jgi:hypothetical protein
MPNMNKSEDWRTLCERATKEKDSAKFMELIDKVISALDECNRESRTHGRPELEIGTVLLSRESTTWMVDA